MNIIGVDPGKHGGMVLVWHGDGADNSMLPAERMPVTEGGYDWSAIHEWLDGWGQGIIVIERTRNVRAGPVGASQPGAVASLAECVGGFMALAAALGWRVVTVAPRTWQAAMLMEGGTSTKVRAREALADLGVTVAPSTDGTRDAALIALWWIREGSVVHGAK